MKIVNEITDFELDKEHHNLKKFNFFIELATIEDFLGYMVESCKQLIIVIVHTYS